MPKVTPSPRKPQFRAREGQKPAFSLIDIIIAVTVISIMAAVSASAIRVTLSGSQFIEKQGVANHLALDALGALQNIRDTTYLRFSSDPDNCWNKLEVEDVSECSTFAETISEGTTYYVVQDFDDSPFGEWHLYEVSADEDSAIDSYLLNGVLHYAQTGITHSDFVLEESNVFDRTVTVQYGDLDGDGTDDYYDATAVVSWTDNSSPDAHSVTKTRRIAHIR